jgi:hypothetical protein
MVHQSDAEADETSGAGAGRRAEMASAAGEAERHAAIAAPAESFRQSSPARRTPLVGRQVDPGGGSVATGEPRFVHQLEPAAIW